MLFPTVEFALFFLAVFLTSWGLKAMPAARKLLLLVASYGFYGFWDWRFCILLAICSTANYLFGLLVADLASERARKTTLIVAIAANLSVLGFFKYWGFFLTSLGDVLHLFGATRDLPIMEVILPVGVSFFIFQGISYVVDVYRKDIEATTSLVDMLLFISFFPQLVAGPIVRAKDFVPQLATPPDPARIRVLFAFLLIASGLFKKVVIAHYLAVELVNPAFESPGDYGTFDLLFAVYGYAVQIYCDFSAYSDIAIGVAALLGYSFPKNFDQPYRASSLRDFWHRWHISLSSWLRDYLYIPLGGSRSGPLGTYLNLFLTMLLGGLWHGAAWNFVLWGALHGSGLGVERWFRGRISLGDGTFVHVMKTFAVFHFVCLTWIFFAAESFGVAWEYLGALSQTGTAVKLLTPFTLTLLAIGIAGQFLPGDLIERCEQYAARIPLAAHGVLMGFVLVALSALGPGALAPFIYFRF